MYSFSASEEASHLELIKADDPVLFAFFSRHLKRKTTPRARARKVHRPSRERERVDRFGPDTHTRDSIYIYRVRYLIEKKNQIIKRTFTIAIIPSVTQLCRERERETRQSHKFRNCHHPLSCITLDVRDLFSILSFPHTRREKLWPLWVDERREKPGGRREKRRYKTVTDGFLFCASVVCSREKVPDSTELVPLVTYIYTRARGGGGGKTNEFTDCFSFTV